MDGYSRHNWQHVDYTDIRREQEAENYVQSFAVELGRGRFLFRHIDATVPHGWLFSAAMAVWQRFVDSKIAGFQLLLLWLHFYRLLGRHYCQQVHWSYFSREI